MNDPQNEKIAIENVIEAAKVISYDHKIDHDCYCVLCTALAKLVRERRLK